MRGQNYNYYRNFLNSFESCLSDFRREISVSEINSLAAFHKWLQAKFETEENNEDPPEPFKGRLVR